MLRRWSSRSWPASWPGAVLALVVPTDEELLIARDTARLIPAAVASGCDR